MRNEIKETVFEFTDADDRACFSSSMRRWVNKAKKLAEAHPDKVKIVAENEDGSICINCPANWFRISPPRKINMSEEQKAAVADRLKIGRKEKKENNE